jgi:hypothetical protein
MRNADLKTRDARPPIRNPQTAIRNGRRNSQWKTPIPRPGHDPGAPGWPSRPARRSQLVGLQDILPTLAGLTGCALPQSVDGLDLSTALRDASPPTRELYYSQCGNDPEQSAMVTDGRWKYCYAEWGGVEELYDLAADPTELVNLVSRPGNADLVAAWRARLIEQARHWGDTGLLSGDGLAASPLDRAAISRLPISGMGWRWF